MEKRKRKRNGNLPESLLYLLTPAHIIDPDILIPLVIQTLRAGADIIQFRNKQDSARELIRVGLRLCDAVHAHGGLFIVNDRVDVAIATGADGVHLGQEDLPISWARRILGPKKGMIIGISTHSVNQALKAESEGADYVGFGPIFPTPAKSGWPTIGTGFFPILNRRLRIPYFAIGGIDLSNIEGVIHAGASRIAVSNGVFGKKSVGKTTTLIKEQLLGVKTQRPNP